MRAGRFNPGTTAEMTIKGAKYTMSPTRMVDAGDDFDWAVYTDGPPRLSSTASRFPSTLVPFPGAFQCASDRL